MFTNVPLHAVATGHSQRDNCSMELEENAAYDINEEDLEGGVYEMVPVATQENQLPNIVKNASNRKPVEKMIATAATIALFIASLALLAAAIAIYFSTEFNRGNNDSEQDATIAALIKTLMRSLGTFWNPVRSCSDLPPRSLSGSYWILNHNNRTSDPVQVYCDINRASCGCDADGVWMRVANLDMTDPNQNCPVGLQQISAPLRLCGRPEPAGCVSTFFRTHGVEYSHVCGRIRAYQKGAPDAFRRLTNFTSQTTDSNYVDGISLTHGQSPRRHIWTFAAALNENSHKTDSVCSCTQEPARSTPTPLYYVPPFILGDDYFCDTAATEHPELRLYPDNPLWDGQGCGNTSTCCEFNNPPWFCRRLPRPTIDDIELRSCGDDAISDENTPIEQVEIYVQ